MEAHDQGVVIRESSTARHRQGFISSQASSGSHLRRQDVAHAQLIIPGHV